MTDAREDVLEAVWEEVIRKFEGKGLDHPASARLSFDPSRHDSCRHFAATTMDGSEVLVAPSLADMPYETVLAILAHEAGHVEDLCCPGVWWYRQGKLRHTDLPNRGMRRFIQAWKDRSDDEVEHVADAIAELALGQRIGYVGHPGCLVQFVGRGKRRPKGLK
jgi:hypothetical protein